MLQIPVGPPNRRSRLASENHVDCTLAVTDIPLILAAIESARTSSGPGEYISRHLRQKLEKSLFVPEGETNDAVRVGSLVTWMSSGGGARTAVLTAQEGPSRTDIIQLDSVLGATLIGMKALDRADLLRPDEDFDVVVVLRLQN